MTNYNELRLVPNYNDWIEKMEEYKTNNKKWLELLSDLTDTAAFLDAKEMESNADLIRTAIDLLKYLNPECHATVSEFEWKRRMKNE